MIRLLFVGALLVFAPASVYTVSVVTNQVFFPGPSGIDLAPDGSLVVGTGGAESIYKTPIIRLQLDGSYAILGNPIRDPDGIAVAADGTVYVGARNGVFKVKPDGTTSLLAMDPSNAGKEFPTSGLLWQADYLALNPVNGDLYCSGSFSGVVKIDTTTGAYQVLTNQVSGGVACTPDGQLYVASRVPGNFRLVKVSPTGVVTTVVGLNGFMTPAALEHHAPSCTWYITTKGPQIIEVPHDGPPKVFAGLAGASDLVFSADGKTMYATAAQAKTVYRLDGFQPATTQPLGYGFPEGALAMGPFKASGGFMAAGIDEGVFPSSGGPFFDNIKVRSGGEFRMVGTSLVRGTGQAGGVIELKGNAKVTGGVTAAAGPTGLPEVPWNPAGVTTISGDVTFSGATTLWLEGDVHLTGTVKATGTLVIYVKGSLTIDGEAWIGRFEAPFDTHILATAGSTVKLAGQSLTHATIYGPGAAVSIEGGAILHGAVVGGSITGGGGGMILTPPGGGASSCD